MTRFLTFLAVFACCGLNAQTSYYVSPTGDNGDNGTLFDPFLTINHALSVAVPGTTVYVMGGTYSEVVFMPSGTSAANRITLTNYDTQVATLVSPAGNTNAIINITDANFITIKGLEITGYAANNASGIRVEGACTGISIINNRIHDIHFSANPGDWVSVATNAQPVVINGTNPTMPVTNLLIQSNFIYDCRTGYSEAVAVNGNVNGFVIDHNMISGITNDGINATGGEATCSDPQNDAARNGIIRWNEVFHCVSPDLTSAGICTDGADDVVIENNTVYGCNLGIEVGCANSTIVSDNIKVRNNLVFHNLKAGIVLGESNSLLNGKVTNSAVQQNTIVKNNIAGTHGEVYINYTENCTFNGNIVYNTTHDELMFSDAGSVDLACNYNCYYAGSPGQFSWNGNSYSGLANWQSASGGDANSMEREPLLVNISTLNFHMSALSPCIDSGDVAFVADPSESDMDTSTRLQNGRVDIGADEYGTAVGVLNTFDENKMAWRTDYMNDQLVISWANPLRYEEMVILTDLTGKTLSTHKMCYGDQSVIVYFGGLPPGTYYAILRGISVAVPLVVPE